MPLDRYPPDHRKLANHAFGPLAMIYRRPMLIDGSDGAIRTVTHMLGKLRIFFQLVIDEHDTERRMNQRIGKIGGINPLLMTCLPKIQNLVGHLGLIRSPVTYNVGHMRLQFSKFRIHTDNFINLYVGNANV